MGMRGSTHGEEIETIPATNAVTMDTSVFITPQPYHRPIHAANAAQVTCGMGAASTDSQSETRAFLECTFGR